MGYGNTKDGKEKLTISTCACDRDDCYNDFCWDFVGKLKKQVDDTTPFNNKPNELCKNVLNSCRKSINLCKHFTDPKDKLKCKYISQAYSGLNVRYNTTTNEITKDGKSGECLYNTHDDANGNPVCNTGIDALNDLTEKTIGEDTLKSKDVINSLLCNIATSVHNVPKELGCGSNSGKLDVSDWFYTNIFGVSGENHEGTFTSIWLYYISKGIYWLFFGFFILNVAGGFNKVFNYNTTATLFSRKGSGKFILIFIILIGILGFLPFIYGIIKSNDDIITNLNTKSQKSTVTSNIRNYEVHKLNSTDINIQNRISQSDYINNETTNRLKTGSIIYGIIVAVIYLVFAGIPTQFIIFSIIPIVILLYNMTSSFLLSIVGSIVVLGVLFLFKKIITGLYPKMFKSIFSFQNFLMAFILISVFVAFNYLGGYFGTFMPAIMIILTVIQKILDTSWGNTTNTMSGNTPVISYLLGNILLKFGICVFAVYCINYMKMEKNIDDDNENKAHYLNSEFIRNFMTVVTYIIIIQSILVITKTVTAYKTEPTKNNPYFLSNYLVRGWLPFGMSAFYYIVELCMKLAICGNKELECGAYEGLFNFFAGINSDG